MDGDKASLQRLKPLERAPLMAGLKPGPAKEQKLKVRLAPNLPGSGKQKVETNGGRDCPD